MKFKIIACIGLLFFHPVSAENVQSLIRKLPYQSSKNFYNNLKQIRSWVLKSHSFCEKVDRHILFNWRAEFLGYIDNLATSEQTQAKLNLTRQALKSKERASAIVVGTEQSFGYPFALNCDQPHVDIKQSIKVLRGDLEKDRLWGTWDGLSAGKKNQPIPLYQLVEQVYRAKSKVIGQPIVNQEFRLFLGQIIIESGAKKHGVSAANALGMLQLRKEVLNDCQIPERFYLHRMAQVDCAVRLFQQNRRNLDLLFEPIFGGLPKTKKERLFSMLLVQVYHSGIGRMTNLLKSGDSAKAAKYFAKHHKDCSAEDIATGIIFHNIGREELGFASLYYTIDINIVADSICQAKTLKSEWFCRNR